MGTYMHSCYQKCVSKTFYTPAMLLYVKNFSQSCDEGGRHTRKTVTDLMFIKKTKKQTLHLCGVQKLPYQVPAGYNQHATAAYTDVQGMQPASSNFPANEHLEHMLGMCEHSKLQIPSKKLIRTLVISFSWIVRGGWAQEGNRGVRIRVNTIQSERNSMVLRDTDEIRGCLHSPNFFMM